MATPSSLHLTNEEIEEIKQQFSAFDTDGDGTITRKELSAALHVVGREELVKKMVDEMILEADTDGDGKISYEEFIKLMMA